MTGLPAARRAAAAWAREVDRHAVALAVLTAAAAAWGVLAFRHGGGHALVEVPSASSGQHLGDSHASHGAAISSGAAPSSSAAGALTVALAGWALMVVAMMLPPALPLLETVRRLVSRRSRAVLLTLLAAVTFVGAWTLVGAVLIAAYFVVRAQTHDVWAVGTDLAWVAGAVVAAAGVYQFTPLKDWCLRGCRSPRSFVLRHWQGRRSAPTELLAVTSAYAASCVGCCWALMLVCFAVGTAALPVMVVLTTVMAAERLVPWGRRLVRPTGAALVALGVAMVATPLVQA